MTAITFKIKENDLVEFKQYLVERENSAATIEKYLRDIRKFIDFSGENVEIDKEKLLKYKEWLIQNYTVSSVNSMVVALNQFLTFREMGRLRLKQIKVQRSDIMGQGKEQIAMIMETICATGIRISELKFFRVETVRTGMVKVWNKGKYRIVLIPDMLKKKLLLLAGVSLKKVFPHNLRHHFARVFYRKTKNLINLADILGHSSLDVTKIYATDGIREWKKNIEQMRILEET